MGWSLRLFPYLGLRKKRERVSRRQGSAAPGQDGRPAATARFAKRLEERSGSVDRQLDKGLQLKRLIGRRVLTAAMGLFMLSAGSSAASAQTVAGPIGVAAQTVRSAVSTVRAATTTAMATVTGSVIQTTPASSVSVSLVPAMATEAAWLYQNGWPLYALVDRYSAGAPLDEEANCIATAVYFEARGESLEGQLAVARVIMNRAASGRYPASWCSVVKQPAQFSFVRRGVMPNPRYESDAWKKAQGVTRVAMANVVPSLTNDVLWYHADYVDPSWGHRLSMAQKIGQHIFYR